MATITSNVTSGLWSSTSSWVGGVLPGAADTAVIAAGANINITAAPTIPAAVTVNGSLTLTYAFPTSAPLKAITVNSGGTLVLATSQKIGGTCTFNSGATLTFNPGGYTLTLANCTLNLNTSVTLTAGNIEVGDDSMGPGNNTGTLVVGGNLSVASSAGIQVRYNSTIKVVTGGWLNWYPTSGSMLLSSGSTFWIDTNGIVTWQSKAPTMACVSGAYAYATMKVFGTLNVDVGGQLNLSSWYNDGFTTVDLSGGTINVWGDGDLAIGPAGTLTTTAATRVKELADTSHLVWAGPAPQAGVLVRYVSAGGGGGGSNGPKPLSTAITNRF